jgi:hypothetical protein
MTPFIAAALSMFIPTCEPRDCRRAWVDGRCTPYRKRHGKTAKNRAKAKAARDARKR